MVLLTSIISITSYSLLGIIGFPALWYALGLINKNKLRKIMFNIGEFISGRLKTFPNWDKYMEPILIRQITLLFIASYSLLQGMISDNSADDKNIAMTELISLKNEIMPDLLEIEDEIQQNENTDTTKINSIIDRIKNKFKNKDDLLIDFKI